MSDRFSPEALRKTREGLPPEQGGIGVVVTPDDLGVQGSASKQIGKGWTVQAVGSWMKDAGYSAAAWLGWKGK